MKKSVKLSSLVITLVLLAGMFGGTNAFAAAKQLSFYPTGQRSIEVNVQDYFKVITSAAEPPTVESSDTAILEVELDQLVGDATLKTYQYRYKGLKTGSVTVTVASKDGLTAKETFVVKTASKSAFESDTSGDVKIKKGSSYTMKITSFKKDGAIVKPAVSVGSNKVIEIKLSKQTGSNFYYKITAVGKVNQASGVYLSGTGIKQVKQCKVTIVDEEQKKPTQKTSKVKCDTVKDFGISKGASYSFKLTASKGVVPAFSLGSKGVFSSKFVKKTGNDYYYKITATGKPGQSAGVYTSAPGEKPVKQCKVTIAQG